jgi:hypothetical protein
MEKEQVSVQKLFSVHHMYVYVIITLFLKAAYFMIIAYFYENFESIFESKVL